MTAMSTSSEAGSSSGSAVGDVDFTKSATPEPSGTCDDYMQRAVAGMPGSVCAKWGPRVTSTGMAISASVGVLCTSPSSYMV